MSKPRMLLFGVVVSAASLVPAAGAAAIPLGSNHNETLLLDA